MKILLFRSHVAAAPVVLALGGAVQVGGDRGDRGVDVDGESPGPVAEGGRSPKGAERTVVGG